MKAVRLKSSGQSGGWTGVRWEAYSSQGNNINSSWQHKAAYFHVPPEDTLFSFNYFNLIATNFQTFPIFIWPALYRLFIYLLTYYKVSTGSENECKNTRHKGNYTRRMSYCWLTRLPCWCHQTACHIYAAAWMTATANLIRSRSHYRLINKMVGDGDVKVSK